ncbi:AraC family transcriptional regulator [Acidaminobacter sp. JC074]|uniref:AraC family transcriptional regulator n=1 Tax=Acidaminobacter sp. JC074 TaxID=2530199 RepID=UPI001F0DC5CB|nr:AraC family transcriptional regulator [Acidaminobacter sp. JC074]
MTDKRKELISSIVSTKQYKAMELSNKDIDDFIVTDDVHYVFSKTLFDLDSKMFSVMRNVYNLGVVSHRHDFYEIQYVYSGLVKQRINGQKVELKKGTMTLFNKHVMHNIESCTSNDRMYHIALNETAFTDTFFNLIVDKSPIKAYLQSDDPSSDYLTLDCSHPFFEQYFEAIEKEYVYRQEGYEKNIQMYLALIFNKYQQLVIEENSHDASSLKHKRIREIKQIMDDQYKEITLESLSEQLHVHPNYLSRFIAGEMHSSFKKLLIDIRLKKASYMLLATDSSIEMISDEVGYKNVNYFYKVFKEVYKMTPSEYRKKNR